MYTGYCAYTGCYTQSTQTIQGQKFNQYFADATLNPFTGQLETSTSFTTTISYLHYWTPEWRSAFFGSYGEQSFSNGARLAQGAIFSLENPNGTNAFGSNAVGVPGTRFYQLSQALRDTYQFVAGGSIIWSPVKDLDIGVEAFYTQIGLKSGRAIDLDKSPTALLQHLRHQQRNLRCCHRDERLDLSGSFPRPTRFLIPDRDRLSPKLPGLDVPVQRDLTHPAFVPGFLCPTMRQCGNAAAPTSIAARWLPKGPGQGPNTLWKRHEYIKDLARGSDEFHAEMNRQHRSRYCVQCTVMPCALAHCVQGATDQAGSIVANPCLTPPRG